MNQDEFRISLKKIGEALGNLHKDFVELEKNTGRLITKVKERREKHDEYIQLHTDIMRCIFSISGTIHKKKGFEQTLDLSIPEKKEAVYTYLLPEIKEFSESCIKLDEECDRVFQKAKDFEKSL